jgi:hypothetical protein
VDANSVAAAQFDRRSGHGPESITLERLKLGGEGPGHVWRLVRVKFQRSLDGLIMATCQPVCMYVSPMIQNSRSVTVGRLSARLWTCPLAENQD